MGTPKQSCEPSVARKQTGPLGLARMRDPRPARSTFGHNFVHVEKKATVRRPRAGGRDWNSHRSAQLRGLRQRDTYDETAFTAAHATFKAAHNYAFIALLAHCGGGMEGGGGPAEDDPASLLVPPAALVTLHWMAYPDLPPRQGRAAARLAVLASGLLPADQLFAAVDENDDPSAPHLIALASRSDMQHWMLWAQNHGLDPDIIVPAPLLIEAPEQGLGRAMIGGAAVLRLLLGPPPK